ncbi:MAG: sulfite exporter TauE/SafE family protein [Hyphomicrobiales bacterium]|nr:sulfite exporter TauE/SafE family protein [Hyphomicrobiales bacterium]
MITDFWFYVVAVPAVLLMGLGKGGFAGTGVLALPLMALVIPPIQAITIILPILMVQDIVSLWAFRNDYSSRSLKILFPGGALGMIAGYFTAATVSNGGVLVMVGIISVVFVIHSVAGQAARALAPAQATWGAGSFWATISGFTSFIANAGGPPFQVFMVPQKLPPKIYAGTSAIFFAVLNYIKFFAFMHLGWVSMPNLTTSAVLFPLAIAATIGGVWLLKRVPLPTFYRIIYALTLIVGVKLIWDGARVLGWL